MYSALRQAAKGAFQNKNAKKTKRTMAEVLIFPWSGFVYSIYSTTKGFACSLDFQYISFQLRSMRRQEWQRPGRPI